MRAIALAACLAIACGGGQPHADEPKRVDLTLYLPATLEVDKPATGDPRVAHLRVYADAAVRASPKWKDELTDEIDYASSVMQPLLGVRLQVDKLADWDRGSDLPHALEALKQLDAGSDATWVIGVTGPLDVAAKALTELGDARPLGTHVVIHAWAEKPETDAMAMSLPAELTDAQRQEIVGAHRRHKQAVVLLHQLAVTLGVPLTTDPSWISSPLYSSKQVTFPDRAREVMQLALDRRLAHDADEQVAAKLLELLDKAEWGGWVPAGKDDVVTALRAVVDAKRAGKTESDVPAEAYAQYDRIRELRKRDPHQALVELDNLLSAYPGNATLRQLKCDIMLDKPGVKSKETRAACTRASELAPGDPGPHLSVGAALLAGGDVAGARTELAAAEGRIDNLEHGRDDAWRRLTQIYADANLFTWAEDAIAKSKLADPIASQIAQRRARWGVPRDAKIVAPDKEPELAAAFHKANDLMNGNKHGDARAALDAADRKFPNAPGLLAVRCDLALRDGDVGGARALCARAVKLQPTESWALYLGGVIALKDTSAAGAQAGIALLKSAIAADPDLGQAWRALAKAYAREKDSASYEALAKAYGAKFGSALPN